MNIARPAFLKLTDKVNLRYQKSGDGPPLILLHTIRTQIEYFRSLAPLLAEKFTVYAVDMPGHGFSSVDTSQQYDEPYLRWGIAEFLKTLDLRDVTMVGESIGAVIALTVASEVPERIKAVYAFNPYDYETRYGDGIRRGNGGWEGLHEHASRRASVAATQREPGDHQRRREPAHDWHQLAAYVSVGVQRPRTPARERVRRRHREREPLLRAARTAHSLARPEPRQHVMLRL